MKNIFYFRYISPIGGIETFFYYLAKKYHNKDITIYYSDADYRQIQRLVKYVRCKKYNGEKIKCEKAFFCFNIDIIDNVEADEYIQVIHGDYKAHGIKPNTHPKINKYLGVSKIACETFTELTGYPCELVYNPIAIDEPKKMLNLISATRLSSEKGKDRMIQLANMLDAADIPYLWTIFTNDRNAINNPNVVYMKPRLDIINYIANADYLIQLSNTEGYCYSIVEALSVGTPVIVTDMPVLKEIGVKNGENGFIVDFDMKNVPIKAIYDGLQPFEYKPINDGWEKIMAKGKSTYKRDPAGFVKVKPIKAYYDLQLERTVTEKNEPFEVAKSRAEYLESLGLVTVIDNDGRK